MAEKLVTTGHRDITKDSDTVTVTMNVSRIEELRTAILRAREFMAVRHNELSWAGNGPDADSVKAWATVLGELESGIYRSLKI